LQDDEQSKAQRIKEPYSLRQRLSFRQVEAGGRLDMQSALSESENRFRKIFEHSNDAIYLIDPESDLILDVNPTACLMLGYSHAELLALDVSAIHPDEMPQLRAFVRSVQASGRGWTNELSCRTKSGHFLPVEISASVVEIEQRTCMIAMVRDTTERKEAELRIRKEADRADALAHSARRLNAQLALETVLAAVCEETARALNVPAAAVLFFDPERERFYPAATWGLPSSFQGEYIPDARAVYEQHPQPYYPQIVVPNLRDLSNLPNSSLFARYGIHAIAIASLNPEDNLMGALAAYALDPERTFSEDDISLLRSLADQAALAIRNANLYEESRHFAALEERQRLARELHDSVTQSLYGMTLYAGAAQDLLALGDIDSAREQLNDMQEMVQAALGELRLLIYQLRPLALEDGLASALQERLETVEARSGLATSFRVEGTIHLRGKVEEELYRVALEALNNVIKHARATTVQICLVQNEQRLRLEITDNGKGFALEAIGRKRGWGITGMMERIERLQGTLNVQSQPGQGTQIVVEVPSNG
jgi:PAS domain S-box-containing protein